MTGIELAEKYFEEYGRPMLEAEFPELMPYLAAGLVGPGSECFGYDDEVSRDHDFEPGFCIFLPGEDIIDRKAEFRLERAYAKLPKEFEGFKRSSMLPVGGARHGILRTAEFYREKAGIDGGKITAADWLGIPEYALAEATNGKVFMDNYGEFSALRAALCEMPEDIRRKRLAGNVLLMAQSGQYNFPRIIKHGELAAAQLAVFEFAKSAMNVIFLLNKKFMPYYKWSFRAMKDLPKFSELGEQLAILMTTDNEGTNGEDKYYMMEDICALVIGELIEQGLTKASCGDMEKHAYSINDGIEDPEIRNLNVLAAV